MLLPREVNSPSVGKIHYLVGPKEWVTQGTQLAEIEGQDSQPVQAETFSEVLELLVQEASQVSQGDRIILLSADPNHVWEALRAISLVGGPEELPLVESIAQDLHFNEETRNQATLTAQAIQDRLKK
jgi:predicted deacylase